jgi:hypothetical protein
MFTQNRWATLASSFGCGAGQLASSNPPPSSIDMYSV